MARKPNYNFERRERERVKAAKKTARLEAKRERSEKRKSDAAGLTLPGEDAIGEETNGEATGETTDGPALDSDGAGPMAQPENNQE